MASTVCVSFWERASRRLGEGIVFNLLTAVNILVTNVQAIALKFIAQSVFASIAINNIINGSSYEEV